MEVQVMIMMAMVVMFILLMIFHEMKKCEYALHDTMYAKNLLIMMARAQYNDHGKDPEDGGCACLHTLRKIHGVASQKTVILIPKSVVNNLFWFHLYESL
jgi:hypothetical protein